MSKLDKLFEKTKIGTMELKNRVVLAEIGTQADEEGNISQRTIDFYIERARGGAGLIMVGGTCPDVSGMGNRYLGRLYDDKYVPVLTKMARLIHEASPGVKAGIQLMHVGRNMYAHRPNAMPGVTPVAPSPIKALNCMEPRELTTKEVGYLVKQYVEAARRAKEAGFDCVCVHGAHGYIISQFMSPYTNRRTDKYGGNIENRARFACEIIQGIKQRCGKDFPVLIKINGEDIQIDDKDYLKTGERLTLEHVKVIAPLLEKAGADEIHISSGQGSGRLYMQPKGMLVDFAAEVKKVVNIAVGAINGLDDLLLAEDVLEARKADLIWIARGLIADPELPTKAAEGRFDEIRPCLACGNCLDMLGRGWVKDWRCVVNPDAYRERELHITPTVMPKKVLVIGGGPAGLEAARVAALIGHNVTLWEKDDRLGGQVNLAALPPGKEGFSSLVRYFSTQLKKLGVKVELRKEVTPASVKEMTPDAVIITTGSKSLIPPIPGIDRGNVVDARDVVAGKAQVGDRVVVIGGGEVGMETAQTLAAQGKKITVIARTALGKGMVLRVFEYIYGQLAQHGVEMLTNTSIKEITDRGVAIVDKEGRTRFIEANNVVLAAGAKSDRALYDALEDMAPEIYLAGDCLYPGDIRSAIFQGSSVARMLD